VNYTAGSMQFQWFAPKSIQGSCFLSNLELTNKLLFNSTSKVNSLVAWFEGADELCNKLSISYCKAHSTRESNINFCFRESYTLIFDTHWQLKVRNQPLLQSEFEDQFYQLARGQQGRSKSNLNEVQWFEFEKYFAGFFWSPDDKPFGYFLENAQLAKSIIIFANLPLGETSWINNKSIKSKIKTIYTSTESRRNLDHKTFNTFLNKIREAKNIPINLICFDCGTNQSKYFLFSGSVDSGIDYGKTELMITFPGAIITQLITNTPYRLLNNQEKENSSAIMISEILWQGSINNNGIKNPRDEFIELINVSNESVSISNWSFNCKKRDGKQGSILIFPLGEEILPQSRYTVKKTCKSKLFQSNWCHYKLSIPNNAKSCTLYDESSNPVHSFNNLQLNQDIIARSLVLDLNSTNQWKINKINGPENLFVHQSYRTFTYATPGFF
jgi:hypothetical protein